MNKNGQNNPSKVERKLPTLVKEMIFPSAINSNTFASLSQDSTAHMMIVNPLRGSSLMSLFSTHPSTEERIERLNRMSGDSGAVRNRMPHIA